jgi:hypothetical protein
MKLGFTSVAVRQLALALLLGQALGLGPVQELARALVLARSSAWEPSLEVALARLARGVLLTDAHLAGAFRASCRGDLAGRAGR